MRCSSFMLAVVLATLVFGFVPTVGTAPQAGSENTLAETRAYVIGVSDLLSISVWRNEELEVVIPVRPDGRISAPLVGEITVAGLTTEQVRRQLTTRFEEFVNAPAVSVIITEINSRRVFILGEVVESGAYDILQPTSLLQALAMAGGFTEFAKKDDVVLLRGSGASARRSKLSVKKITAGTDLSDNVLLQPGDTIIVP